MPVNQPPMEEDAAKAAWELEVTRLLNLLEAATTELEQRVKELEDDS